MTFDLAALCLPVGGHMHIAIIIVQHEDMSKIFEPVVQLHHMEYDYMGTRAKI